MVDEAPVPAGTLLVVAAALIDTDGRILMQRRPPGKAMEGLWEFPGGKIELGEQPETALIRELHEELGIHVDEPDLVPGPFVSAQADGRHLLMLLYSIHRWRGTPRALEATEIRWDSAENLRDLPMPPPDVPLVSWLCGG